MACEHHWIPYVNESQPTIDYIKCQVCETIRRAYVTYWVCMCGHRKAQHDEKSGKCCGGVVTLCECKGFQGRE